MSKNVQIDRSKPVMVTGASGYVASWIVKTLLEDGLTVHATVRDPQNEKKVSHLKNLVKEGTGELKLFKADLLSKDGFKEAMKGCELVYHTASPFTLNVKNPQKDLIEPAVQGTTNILELANEIESVKRVVVTSSCAAIYSDAADCLLAPNGILTENVWNSTASLTYQPYSYSKLLAEKAAWEISEKQDRWDLVVINPSLVVGPPVSSASSNSESLNLVTQIGNGKLRFGAPKAGIGAVDVRDLAIAHYKAGFTPTAQGRHIASGHNTDFLEIGTVLLDKYGSKYPLPKKPLAKWLLLIIGPLVDKNLTREYIRKNVNIPFNADNSKIKNELGVTFRPLKETMEDMFQAMIDDGIIKSR